MLALYPDIAPQHVAQILRLVRIGVYDTIGVYRVDPSFLVQLFDARNRQIPLTSEQDAAIQPLKAELSSLHHRRGTLSMAHYEGKLDSAETSFSILLVDAPHLDGRYTIFGHLEKGYEVLDAISQVPRKSDNQPMQPVIIDKAEIAASPEALSGMNLRLTPSPIALSSTPVLLAGVATVFGLTLFFFADRVFPSIIGSFGLLATLVGFFVLFITLVPHARFYPWLAIAIFFGTLAVFKLMNRFESKGSL